MTMFIHRCTECDHAHYEHAEARYKGRSCSFGWCPCSQVLAGVLRQPSEPIPRWDSVTGNLVARVAAPGERLVDNPNAGVVAACARDACQEAYAKAPS